MEQSNGCRDCVGAQKQGKLKPMKWYIGPINVDISAKAANRKVCCYNHDLSVAQEHDGSK